MIFFNKSFSSKFIRNIIKNIFLKNVKRKSYNLHSSPENPNYNILNSNTTLSQFTHSISPIQKPHIPLKNN